MTFDVAAVRAAPATAYFRVAGHTPQQAAEHLAARGINAWHGHHYAWELTAALGLRETGGAVRAGLVRYNDRSEVDRLLAAVAELPPPPADRGQPPSSRRLRATCR